MREYILFYFVVLSFCLQAQNNGSESARTQAIRIANENGLKGAERDNYVHLYTYPAKFVQSENKEEKTSSSCGTAAGTNIGFELNNYSDWIFWGGTNLRSITDSLSYVLTPGTKTLISGGTDPVSSVSLTSPLGGLKIIKLNDNIANAQVTSMKTKFKVTPVSSLLKTATSLVFQTAGHDCKDNPFYKLQIMNCDETIIYHEYYSLRADAPCTGVNPFAFTGSYTPWHILCYDLSSYMGQTVVLKVTVGDCVFTGHYGYCYFDAALSSSPGYPLSSLINVNGTNYPFNSNFNSVCLNNSISVSAPSGASSYSWTGPFSNSATQTFSNTFDGYYSVAMTSTNGCRYEKHYLLNLTPTVSISTGTTTVCPGTSYSMAASGGSSYSWTPLSVPSATVYSTSFSSLTHTLTGYNFNKVCSGTATQSITVYSNPTITTSGNASVCIGNSITLTANGASTYTWNTGANTSSIVVSPTVNTFYSVGGSSSFGCNLSVQSLSVQAVASNTNVFANATSTSICLGDSTLLSATFGQGAYLWNTGATTYTTYVKPTNTTMYSVSIGSVCPVSRTIQITVNSPTGGALTVTSPASVCPGTNFTVSSTGYTSYSYKFGTTIYNGNPITANIPAYISNFTVTATDAGGCKTFSVIPIHVYTVAPLSVSGHSVCAGQTATMVASGANTYTWSNSTQVGTGAVLTVPSASLSSFYWLYGTTSDGCNSNTLLFYPKIDPSTISITPSSYSTCIGGTVNLFTNNFNSPTTYTWSTGSNSSGITVSPSVTTTYSLTVSNSLCGSMNASQTITVSPFNSPTISIVSTATSICIGNSATLTASGANTYSWNTGQVPASISASSSFTGALYYWVTGTDANGCKSTSPTFTIYNFGNPTVSISGANSICPGGSSTLTASGANTYSWSTGSTSNPIVVSPSSNTIYTVTGYNSSGCSAKATRTVSIAGVPSFTLSATQNSVCPGGSSILTATDAFGILTYSWSTGSVYDTTKVTPPVSTIYTCTSTFGCPATRTIGISVAPLPTVNLGVSSNTFCPYSGALLTLYPSPSGGFYSPGGITSNTLMLNTPGTYTISYQVNSPCVNKTTQTITVFPQQCVTTSASPDSLCVGQSSTITYTPGGGSLTGPFLSGNVFTPSSAGTYSINYNYIDAYGCSYNECESIFVNLCTSIAEEELTSLRVIPNPFENEFLISNPNNLKVSATIYDVTGKLISNFETEVTERVNTSEFASGIYYLQLRSNEFVRSIKLAKH